jgi:hypothetical protein
MKVNLWLNLDKYSPKVLSENSRRMNFMKLRDMVVCTKYKRVRNQQFN